MQILIADDDPSSRHLAQHVLSDYGSNIRVEEDGAAALRAIETRHAPMLVITDRNMPGMSGLDLCRQARMTGAFPPLYIVMVTVAGSPTDVAEGLDAGADDYVVNPFNPVELRARAQVGMRMLALQESVARRVGELEEALANVKALRGLLPMCACCKKIRVEERYWQQLEGYLADHADARPSHGICPECAPARLDEAVRNPG